MRHTIIIAFLTILLLGASNSFAYKRGRAVHQTSQESHHKGHAVAHHKGHTTAGHHKGHAVAHHKGHGTHHKSYATHHKGRSHGTHHTGYAAHHAGHRTHKKTEVIEEEVFNYPVQRTPAAAPVPVQKTPEASPADKTEKSEMDYKCYRAWKKEIKREKKEFKASIKDAEGMPWAAERKKRKAYKKAWKADMIEHEYETGYYYDNRAFWWY